MRWAAWQSSRYCVACLNTTERVDLKSFHHKEKRSITMYGVDINETYCGNHFAVYTIIKSVYSTTETNIMYVSYNKKIKETFVEGGLLRRMGQ